MILIALIAALAAVLIIAAWKIPGAVVTMHQSTLDHRYRVLRLQDKADEHAHRRYLEMENCQRNDPAAELAVRATKAAARQAAAEARRTEARQAETEWLARRSRC